MIERVRVITQLTMATVFLFSAAGKLKDPKGFVTGVENFELLPAQMAPGVAVLVMATESWLAIAHLMGWWLEFTALIAFSLLMVFGVAVTVNLVRGRELPCYCFDTTGHEMISSATLVRLFLLLSAEAFLLVRLHFFANEVQERLQGMTDFGLALCWVVFLLTASSWFLIVPELRELLVTPTTIQSTSEATTRELLSPTANISPRKHVPQASQGDQIKA